MKNIEYVSLPEYCKINKVKKFTLYAWIKRKQIKEEDLKIEKVRKTYRIKSNAKPIYKIKV